MQTDDVKQREYHETEMSRESAEIDDYGSFTLYKMSLSITTLYKH